MRLFMTDGLFGRCLEQIGPEFKTLAECLKELEDWKKSKMNQKFYKIEPFNSLTYKDETNEIGIDFGDYSTFMLVTGNNEH